MTSTHLVILVEILVILIKVIHVLILVILLVLQSLAGKVVDGTGDDLLLKVLSELVIRLETGIELLELGLVDIVGLEGFGRWWLRRLEKVEEGLGWDFLSDRSGLAGRYLSV